MVMSFAFQQVIVQVGMIGAGNQLLPPSVLTKSGATFTPAGAWTNTLATMRCGFVGSTVMLGSEFRSVSSLMLAGMMSTIWTCAASAGAQAMSRARAIRCGVF